MIFIPPQHFEQVPPSTGGVSDLALQHAARGRRAAGFVGDIPYAVLPATDDRGFALLGISHIQDWLHQAAQLVPVGLRNFIDHIFLVVVVNIRSSFYVPDYGIVGVGVDEYTTRDGFIGMFAHEVWHAYSQETDFWHSSRAKDLLDMFGLYDGLEPEWIDDEIERRWERGVSPNSIYGYDEQMGDALANKMLGRPFADAVEVVYRDITHGFMQTYLQSRVAAWQGDIRIVNTDALPDSIRQQIADIEGIPLYRLPSQTICVALDGDVLAGSVALDSDPYLDIMWITGTIVVDEYRGRGIADQMLVEVAMHTQSLGISRIGFEQNDNPSFWKRFSPSREKVYDVGAWVIPVSQVLGIAKSASWQGMWYGGKDIVLSRPQERAEMMADWEANSVDTSVPLYRGVEPDIGYDGRSIGEQVQEAAASMFRVGSTYTARVVDSWTTSREVALEHGSVLLVLEGRKRALELDEIGHWGEYEWLVGGSAVVTEVKHANLLTDDTSVEPITTVYLRQTYLQSRVAMPFTEMVEGDAKQHLHDLRFSPNDYYENLMWHPTDENITPEDAFGFIQHKTVGDGDISFVDGAAVRDRGKGHGTQMMDEFEHMMATQHGVGEFRLNSEPHANSFWAGRGYEPYWDFEINGQTPMSKAAAKRAWSNTAPAAWWEEPEVVDAAKRFRQNDSSSLDILSRYHETNRESAPMLWRGIKDSNNLQPGDIYKSEGLDSWTADDEVAYRYSGAFEGWDNATVLHLEEGEEGLNLGRVSDDVYDFEQEWLLDGEFEVTDRFETEVDGEYEGEYLPVSFLTLKRKTPRL